MTTYEFKRWLTYRLLPTHLVTVRNDIKSLIKSTDRKASRMSILDVGGRKSPYTVNLSADITLLDVPQESGTKEDLNLGFTQDILGNIKNNRSNIKDIVIQDMTKSTLENESYDAVVCIEVIEHVEDDETFVKNISKVIRTNGWVYFTTPNGDYIKNEGPNKNPDHVRHYTRSELKSLLEKYFKNVDVHYAVKTGMYRVQGLRSYKLSRPVQTIKSIVSNIINRYQSRSVAQSPIETAHLVAIAYK